MHTIKKQKCPTINSTNEIIKPKPKVRNNLFFVWISGSPNNRKPKDKINNMYKIIFYNLSKTAKHPDIWLKPV